MTQSSAAGTLYIVGMPLGNPGDITLRALSLLRRAQLVLAEHPGTTDRLLNTHGITTPCERYSPGDTMRYLQMMTAGSNIALVSDVGLPGIADPGTAIIDAAWVNGLPVDIAPGASAVTAALAISGLFTQRFQFFGFPPRKTADRSEFFKEIADYNGTIVMYETRRGLRSTLKDLNRTLDPKRRMLVAGGMTTPRAVLRRCAVADVNSHEYLELAARRGPFTLVIER